jgi:hypothetical protein
VREHHFAIDPVRVPETCVERRSGQPRCGGDHEAEHEQSHTVPTSSVSGDQRSPAPELDRRRGRQIG